ncbi:MAG: arginine repressor [Armatimonadota bacterium]|nr:arginine repressor [Armatimonadota bacterium]MDR7451255.1 arginine repressor [Armatimonadota bacterium]MDR7466842.1 arginine repressor [Armatimonadota bacterium]MDR7492685.1 arginine repressor [Armatimonadota bacterium]MDR7499614.1 arginine repressor [Armatimonadota bacterium]
MAAPPASERSRIIRRILREEAVATQLDLVRALRRRGIVVTQATVSRDIRRLGLVKVPGPHGPRYALAVEPPRPVGPQRFGAVMEEFAREVIVACGLVLVKTVPGGAAPVAQAIDDIHWPDVAGTLAGEDTIIVVPRRQRLAGTVARRLRGWLPSSP